MNNVIEFKNIKKAYEDKVVISDFNLSIEKGEFVTIIGSSGCGKTTTLKMIGGFLKPNSGEIWVDGQNITYLEPEERPVSTVFQSYALFPHLTVLENVMYGLKFQKIKKKEAKEMGMEVQVRNVSVSEYYNADEVFICGTVGEVVPVKMIDGKKIGTQIPGPITEKFSQEYKKMTETLGVSIDD